MSREPQTIHIRKLRLRAPKGQPIGAERLSQAISDELAQAPSFGVTEASLLRVELTRRQANRYRSIARAIVAELAAERGLQ